MSTENIPLYVVIKLQIPMYMWLSSGLYFLKYLNFYDDMITFCGEDFKMEKSIYCTKLPISESIFLK